MRAISDQRNSAAIPRWRLRRFCRWPRTCLMRILSARSLATFDFSFHASTSARLGAFCEAAREGSASAMKLSCRLAPPATANLERPCQAAQRGPPTQFWETWPH